MFRIAYCDDNTLQREILQDLLQEYIRTHQVEAEITEFSMGRALLDNVAKSGSYDIYILDILMPFMSGVEVARELKKTNSSACIVFLTSSPDYVFEAFDMHAYQYLMKPIELKRFVETMDNVIEESNRRNGQLLKVKIPGGETHVPIRSISHALREERSPVYYMTDGSVITGSTLRGSFKEVVAPLLEDSQFIMVGTVACLNLCQIEEVEKGFAVMRDGSVVDVPVRMYTTLKKAVEPYL